MNRIFDLSAALLTFTLFWVLLLITSSVVSAQIVLRPSIGFQSLNFNGQNAIKQPIGSIDKNSIGGGFRGPQNGINLQLELFSKNNAWLRIPFAFEATWLSGKTTFTSNRIINDTTIDDSRTLRTEFLHSGNIFSAGTGFNIALFKSPTLYFSAMAKLNYMPTSDFVVHQFYLEDNETVGRRDLEFGSNNLRLGATLKTGVQLELFDPFLFDMNIGYGALNLIGRPSDIEERRELFIVLPDANDENDEKIVGYITVGMSLIWKL